MVQRPYAPLPAAETAASAGPASVADLEAKAREYLEALGRGDHPDAHGNPLYALYQVAVDFRCSAYGYRTLYFHRDGPLDAT